MATSRTYSETCDSVGGYSYADNFKLYVELTEVDVNVSNNTSKVRYDVYCEADGSGSISAKHLKYFRINGETIINETVSVNASSPDAYISIASGTTGAITHNSDGKKSISFEAEIDASSYGLYANIEDTFALSNIPRYATLNQSVNSRGLNTIKMNWSSNSVISQVWYSINNGSWVSVGNPNSTSGTYTITGLNPNTNYNIRTSVRRKDSQLDTNSDNLSVSTYDIARLTSYPNFNIGDSVTVTYTNPANAPIQVGVYLDGNTEIAPYRNCSGSSYTFNFTDEELDRMYKLLQGNTLTARFYINTNNNTWRESRNITITLTGNQKTGHINVNAVWKRSKKWININGVWKRCVRWKNVNGVWKRCI